MHSGCALKMAAFQVLLRRGRNLDKILHRSCRLDNKISWNIRCIHQGNIHAFKLEQRMLGKSRTASVRLTAQDPFKLLSFTRPVSSQSQGNFLTDLKSSPPPALYLGFSGAIPFCGLATMAIIFPEHLHLIAHAQQAYGACILSFLGAIHWGFALAKTSELKPDWSTLGYSVTPSLMAWLALLVTPVPGLTTLCIGLAFALSRDLNTPHFPAWYYALRKALSTLAVSSVGLTAAVLYFH